ncbi:hypothetical protein ACFFJY_06000 [Fictibacillus aquaticus]|uniref:Membrane-spanning protein n=1 Tax=Fictibacillus aquaticus TaxID=2021314 RepID=A0A235FBU1_9BACL|nr:hypothetical protein [Fictibacillus aquaticus]OYD58245.1 hypothetical protein CGZ90_10210 [Fictibacillus aquaticus]
MNRKIIIILSWSYTIFMAAMLVYYYPKGDVHSWQVAAAGILCGAVPIVLAHFTKVKFNMPLIVSYIGFLFASQYLGSIRGFYGLGWWDTFLHLLSGVLLGFVAVALYERMTKTEGRSYISVWLPFWFILSFSVFGGVVWEIYEFSFDQLFNMTLQGGGNSDTMVDLISDTAGGIAAALWGYLTAKKKASES